ncbi:uncharacterized protein LOC128987130 isoform X1 [Macrosteles quadrilineatus]|uniref:uncharacterized protein LOC128987130 isoform X1 n=1 Tax=Macrosteles quadrilineatus TaxID=74068 RepID=UPI0023E34F65|nr:uncharacterized protein LOC128987130 isoform X1 [Macrosteles quadrilineatus]
MSKELLIVFVYDCERCQREEDDPQDAVVYFYPSWVSEQQRHALCGQLIGVSQCLGSMFSSPNILALQTGKFAIKPIGRFILCVGTDRNIPDIVLDTRINTLFRLLRFYHKDFETISIKAESEFSEKLNQIFETYLPILQYSSNIFGNITTFNLPKSASSVFLEAMQILQCFQDKEGVMGGALLYQNKVVASQLSAKLTKLLVISDPYRIKLPGASVSTQFRLPVGVQLLTVFVEQLEVQMLAEESSQLSAALRATKLRRESTAGKDKGAMKNNNKEPPIGSTFGMKRDVSMMFTTVVEEAEGEVEREKVPDVVKDAVKARKAARLLSVAPSGFVVPDPTNDNISTCRTTDDISFNEDNKICVRYLSLGVANSVREEKEKQTVMKYCNTIADPSFPLFRRNGLPASQALYDTRVTRHYRQLSQETTKEKKPRPKSFALGFGENTRSKKERVRRALNLPLGPSNTDTQDMVPMIELRSKKPNISIPLTPLMAKLSLLAMEQRVGEIPTPADKAANPATPLVPTQPFRKSRAEREREKRDLEPVEENVLYVCGYQDMTLLLLLDSTTSQDPDQIHSLWETSVSALSEIETHLHHCLEHGVASGGGGACESYSYLTVAPQWGTTQRGGVWAGPDLELLTDLHNQFNTRSDITETIVRANDSITFGYNCGGMQVFYHQPCSGAVLAGLPAPSDLMGVVALKAKRRLERDHSIVLL